MIVGLIQREGRVIAVNNWGELLLWNITPKHPGKPHHFQHNVSIVKSILRCELDKKELIGIANVGQYVLVYNTHNCYLVQFQKLKEIDNSEIKSKQIKIDTILAEEQCINYIQAVSGLYVVVGTNKGNIVGFDLGQEKQVARISLSLKTRRQKDKHVFATSIQKQVEVTCIVTTSCKRWVMVSLDTGRFFVLECDTLNVTNQVSGMLKTPLQKIGRLFLKESQNKVYSIHDNYVLEWNYKLNKCLGSIQFHKAQGIFINENHTFIIGNSSNMTLLEGANFTNEKQIQLSMRGAGVMKCIGGDTMAVGGSDCIIDIFSNSLRIMTLIP